MSKVIPIKQITSWSFSRYLEYSQCPFKAKCKHIDKIKEPSAPALERGTAIHKIAEQYVKGQIQAKMPEELKLFSDEFKAHRKQFQKSISGMSVEDTWAFRKDWSETTYNDWTNCWLRVKLDLAHHEDDETLIVTDYKTGKFRDEKNAEYMEQLELYAPTAMLTHPHIKTVKPRLMYLDSGILYPDPTKPLIYKRVDLEKFKKMWEKRVRPMFVDKIFAPRPNNMCRFCFFGHSGKLKGGPGTCKF